MTQSMMNLGGAVSFCLHKTNHIIDLTDGRDGDYRVHVHQFTTCVLLNKMNFGSAFSKITLLKAIKGNVSCHFDKVYFYWPTGDDMNNTG